MTKALVAYFSATGTTRRVAEVLAREIGADIYEIKPETPYSDGDLDWRDDGSRSTVEMRDKACRPAMEGDTDTSGYDEILIGFPIWWYDAPRIIDTFLDAHDLSGKRVAPFATSGGSQMDGIAAGLSARHPAATWLEGMRFGSADPVALKEWAEGLRSLRHEGPYYVIRRCRAPLGAYVRKIIVRST